MAVSCILWEQYGNTVDRSFITLPFEIFAKYHEKPRNEDFSVSEVSPVARRVKALDCEQET